MDSITQIAEPGVDALAVNLLDARVVVGNCDGLAGDADPIHVAGVLESDLGGLVVLEVFKFLGVVVGEEQEIWADTFGHGHCAGCRPNTRANGGEETAFEAIDDLVHFFELLVYGGGLIPLRGNGGVDLVINLILGEWLDHREQLFDRLVSVYVNSVKVGGCEMLVK